MKYDRCYIWNGLKIEITHTGTIPSHISPNINLLTKLVGISCDTVPAKQMQGAPLQMLMLLQFAMHSLSSFSTLSLFICKSNIRHEHRLVCIYFTEVAIDSLILSIYIKSNTVSCFLINCQGPVVPRGTCQMDRCPCGQGVIQVVHVGPHYVM